MKRSPRQYAEALLAAAHGKSAKEVSAVVDRLRLMLRRNRSRGLLGKILHAYHAAVLERDGIIPASIVTARPMDAKTLERRLSAALGEPIALTTSVDPSILGGAIVTVRDLQVDGSVTTSLARLRTALRSTEKTRTSATKHAPL